MSQEKTAVAIHNIPCRFCGESAQYVDRYRSPFPEDQEVFPESMEVYYCSRECIGFAYPPPSEEDLKQYYNAIYRDSRRLCAEDPHTPYFVLKSTPFAESQFMYLAQSINFDAIRTVIDIGCGHGMLLRHIRTYHPRAQLIGIDLDPAVQPFIQDIGAEFIHASIGESVDVLCERMTPGTLLINSQTLHYQRDHRCINTIIRGVREKSINDVFLFLEVPNSAFLTTTNPTERIYDIPQLLFFTAEALTRSIFDVQIINVATTGWPLEREYSLRKERVENYHKGKKHLSLRSIFNSGKLFLPLRLRMMLKAMIMVAHGGSSAPFYYAYGGDRRAIRMLGRIA